MQGMGSAEIEIEFEDVDARLTKKTELATERMFLDEREHVLFAHVPFKRNPGDLKRRSGRRDIRTPRRTGKRRRSADFESGSKLRRSGWRRDRSWARQASVHAR